MTRIEYDGAGELHIEDIDGARKIGKQQFDKVITVCQDHIKDNVPQQCRYSQYNMSDGEPTEKYGGRCTYQIFSNAADDVYEQLLKDRTVLCHCHAGVSRSVAVSAAALARLLDVRFLDALDIVRDSRSVANPKKKLHNHGTSYANEHKT
jgi:protein-tyrosine phosphatase